MTEQIEFLNSCEIRQVEANLYMLISYDKMPAFRKAFADYFKSCFDEVKTAFIFSDHISFEITELLEFYDEIELDCLTIN